MDSMKKQFEDEMSYIKELIKAGALDQLGCAAMTHMSITKYLFYLQDKVDSLEKQLGNKVDKKWGTR